jgi:hypothetical protein
LAFEVFETVRVERSTDGASTTARNATYLHYPQTARSVKGFEPVDGVSRRTTGTVAPVGENGRRG